LGTAGIIAQRHIAQRAFRTDNDNVIVGPLLEGGAMNFNRPTDLPDGTRSALKPTLYDPHPAPSKTGVTAPTAPRPAPPAPTPTHDARGTPAHEAAARPVAGARATDLALDDEPGSKLFIGVNIKLKGVEISDCDVLVIEGQVDATVHSKLMQIASPGTLHGTALIDVAEIHGEFAGELTARTRLVVHATGRVSGTIRYGKLVVAEGGELSGDVKRLDPAEAQAQRSLLPGSHPRPDPPASAAPVRAEPAKRPV
jgi:cytoskeletal protein CcmA (bactofilin family)